MVNPTHLIYALQSVQHALASINNQGLVLTLSISITPEHDEGSSWKELAEAHLRERVRNPHNYRALSIELYAMEKAGYDWRRDFCSYGELSRFLSSLYSCSVSHRVLRQRIDDLDEERNKYIIEASFSFWCHLTSNFDIN